MRKHPLVKNMRKLNFHLVPMSGVAKRNGGGKKFRAEFVRGSDEGDNRGVLGVDRVLAEAIEAHHLNGVSPDMLKLYVEAVLQTMIDKTVEDGRTRRTASTATTRLSTVRTSSSAERDSTCRSCGISSAVSVGREMSSNRWMSR